SRPVRRGGRERPGLQAEVVLSLGLVMAAATGILGVTLIGDNEARLRALLGRALLAEAQKLPPPETAFVPGTRWGRGVGRPPPAERALAPPRLRSAAEHRRH